jgi:hypothetical protein
LAWLTTTELALYDAMPEGDRRHGLDVVAYLLGHHDASRSLLVAGLLHDCGKGPSCRLPHRVCWSLGQRYGGWIWRAASLLPGFQAGLTRMRDHAELSADIAAAAGCDDEIVTLIRHQEAPTNDDGRLLLEADEAN